MVKNNFFVILRNNRVEYLDETTNLLNTSFLVLKKINPDLEYKALAIGVHDLKAKIIKRIRAGNLSLFRLGKDGYEVIDSFFSRESTRVYFFHVNCSSCQLKSILSNIKIKKLLDQGEIVLIFSVMADRLELSRIIKDQKIDLLVFLDQNDEFGLFSIITEEKNNPIIIEPDEINEVGG